MVDCTVCSTPTTKRCGKCGKTWYCSRDCQRQDWKKHKQNCFPFVIKEAEGKGLGLFATHDLNIGDLIVREDPILFIEGGTPQIIREPKKFKDSFEVLSKDNREKILSLTQGYSRDFLTGDEEWEKGSRIYSNNSISVNPDSLGNSSALYTTIARINHSCTPNAKWSYTTEDERKKEVRAIRKINEGDEVVTDYFSQDGSFLTTVERKEVLKTKWNFDCACSLCASNHYGNDLLRMKLRQLHEAVPRCAGQLDLQGAFSAALEKCHILEKCEDLVSELPVAYLELYETIVGGREFSAIAPKFLGRSGLPTEMRSSEGGDNYRARAYELMKKTKLASDKDGYNKKMMGLARRHNCYNDLME